MFSYFLELRRLLLWCLPASPFPCCCGHAWQLPPSHEGTSAIWGLTESKWAPGTTEMSAWKHVKYSRPLFPYCFQIPLRWKNCQFAISNLIVFPFWKEYLPLPNSQGDVNKHEKKTVPHIGSHPLIFWATGFQIAALWSILMYTLYGWLQANEWFSNKMFGVNQLSKTAEGMCNQAGFE